MSGQGEKKKADSDSEVSITDTIIEPRGSARNLMEKYLVTNACRWDFTASIVTMRHFPAIKNKKSRWSRSEMKIT